MATFNQNYTAAAAPFNPKSFAEEKDMNSRKSKKRVTTVFRRMLSEFSESKRGDLGKVMEIVRRYWSGMSRSPVLVVDERVIEQDAPETTWASTKDGNRIFVRILVAQRAPDWVLEAVLAHELAHIVVCALKLAPVSCSGLSCAEIRNIENEVGMNVKCMGIPAARQNEAHGWLVRYLPQYQTVVAKPNAPSASTTE